MVEDGLYKSYENLGLDKNVCHRRRKINEAGKNSLEYHSFSDPKLTPNPSGNMKSPYV